MSCTINVFWKNKCALRVPISLNQSMLSEPIFIFTINWYSLARLLPSKFKKKIMFPYFFIYSLDFLTCHGTYIRWYLRIRCARKEKSMLFHLFKALDYLYPWQSQIGFFSSFLKDLFSFMHTQNVLSYHLI